ncbi:MAG: hypothetical protein HYS17_08925 [Micavibrio aeruginosavorus]|uniref:Uncharacterized protein n=1 Tax=Micavibrio aeruginosavorus TaxID=349221 RepID=A0A7T5R1C5_9BACT|nr:MAG: hypothetical protein HYS17_08925 [Micavibrio aeruginosavorus]
MKWLKLAFPLMLLTLPAAAEPYTYSPEGCEFTITFPSEPLLGKKCNPDEPSQCHEVLSFTKVFDVTATLKIDVVCNPATPDMYERYSGDVMKTTLIAMAGRGKLEEMETGYNEHPNAKMAFLLGYGKNGEQDLIYNGQLWIGKKSIFSMEADITGDYITGADEMFATILQSVNYKTPPAAVEAETSEKGGKKPEEAKEAAPKE